jgi:hypothetical protein
VTWNQSPVSTPASPGATVPPTAPVAAAPLEPDLVAAAVLACPAVLELHAGGLRQVATYLPGRRVTGVRTDAEVIQVSVVAAAGVPIPAVAAQVRAAVAPLAGDRPVDVHIADVAVPAVAAPDGPVDAPAAGSVQV